MKKQIKQILYDMRTKPLIAWVTVIGKIGRAHV